MVLPTRKISDAQVTSIGYGAMSFAPFYSTHTIPEEEELKLLDSVYENGCTNWDTADIYGNSEVVIGKWLKKTGKRNEIFLATKFGLTPTNPDRMICGSPEYVPKAIDKSLERLGVDYVDLWYLHRADLKVPIELTVGAMAEQVKAGKVKYIGLSEVTPDTLRRAHAVHPIAAIQVEYSPFSLDIEDEKTGILKTARALGVAVVAYAPLGRGLLTGRFKSPDDFAKDDTRLHMPRFSSENFPNVLKVVDALHSLAKKYDASPAQVTLAWLLAQGEDIIPIPGTTRISNLRDNIGAVNLKLSLEDDAEIRRLAVEASGTIAPRNPPQWQAYVMEETPQLEK